MSAWKPHPTRLFLARCVYWTIWGPAVAIAVPFGVIGMLADFLADKLFPRIANAVQPAWAAAHHFARWAGNLILQPPKAGSVDDE